MPVTIQDIPGTEAKQDSRPKINANFTALKDAVETLQGVASAMSSQLTTIANQITALQAGLVTVEDVDVAEYTLVDADSGKLKRTTSDDPVTIIVPTGLRAGFNCIVEQGGAGAVSFIADSASTVNARGDAFTTAGQHAQASVVRTDADTVTIGGDIVVSE